MEPSVRAVRVGQTIGHYRLLEEIGAGGMGVVYKAEDVRLHRFVALKLLPDDVAHDAGALARFRREAEAASALNHPNICTVHDVGEAAEGRAFLVMELLEGESVQDRLRRGPLPLEAVVETGIALADALQTAHAAGIIHRDIKPANTFLTARGPKLLDFGLAKLAAPVSPGSSHADTKEASPLLTDPGGTVGTVAYMAPEQLRGLPVDERSDLFSFGLVLYELTTGRPAFEGTTGAVIAAAILQQTPASPRSLRGEVPDGLNRVILKAIEKDPDLRYQHASELRADLERLKRDGASSLPAIGPAATRSVDRARRPIAMIAAAAATAIVACVAGYIVLHRPSKLTDKDTIVLADFSNTTGDEVFTETLRRGLAVQLEQSPFLSLISDDRIRRTLGLMGRPADQRLTPEIARDLCERTGSAAMLEGSIAALGTQYVLGLRASRCGSGDVIAEEQAQAARKEDVLNVLSQIAKSFRTRVGESLATIEQHKTPLAEATTASLDALKAYSTAWKINGTAGTVVALPLFKRAVDLDPQFAIAWANLGLAYSTIREAALSAESTTRAYELRRRASDPERFFIATMYDRQVTGNLERELQTLTLWAHTYPRDSIPHGLIAGFAANGTGRYELCLEEASKAIALDRELIFPYDSLVGCNLRMDRFDQAERAWQQAASINSPFIGIPQFGYHLAFLKGDQAAMDRQAAAIRRSTGGEETMAHMEGLVLAQAGRLERAANMSRHAASVAEQTGYRESAAIYTAAAAVWHALFGATADARRFADDALRLAKGRDSQYAAAVALAIAGDMARSQSLAADLATRYPEDTSVQTSYLPTLRALASVHAGRPSEAIGLLQAARPYETADPAISFVAFFGALYPVYVRGEAFLSARQGAEAAAEFQKILDHRGLLLADPLGARARLELGRAWALAGDRAKAKAAYEDFLALWKDADSGVPILRQANAEYANLQ